jgi:monofunctional biosynthetic peptidoglycan transglycosylase
MEDETPSPPAPDADPPESPSDGAPAESPAKPERGSSRRRQIAQGSFGALLAIVALAAGRLSYELSRLPDPATLADADPSSTAFIDRYREQQRSDSSLPPLEWQPVPDDHIAPTLLWAVVVAEDIEFFSHTGFSGSEIRQALRDAMSGGRRRGASTITQQLAKNLWLSPSRSPVRKLKEAVLTRRLEERLTKRRILELYLNVVEFGPGIYGAQSAALHYFDKPAASLTLQEAALLAATLPRPASWNPESDSPAYARYVEDIRGRLRRAAFLERYLPPILPAGVEAPETPASLPADSSSRPPPGDSLATAGPVVPADSGSSQPDTTDSANSSTGSSRASPGLNFQTRVSPS